MHSLVGNGETECFCLFVKLGEKEGDAFRGIKTGSEVVCVV